MRLRSGSLRDCGSLRPRARLGATHTTHPHTQSTEETQRGQSHRPHSFVLAASCWLLIAWSAFSSEGSHFNIFLTIFVFVEHNVAIPLPTL